MKGIINRNIIRTNLTLLLANMGILLIAAWILFSSYNYYYNFFYGPFPITRNELFSIENPDSGKELFIEVKGDTVFESGFSQIERKMDRYSQKIKSESTVGFYEVLKMDSNFILIYSKSLSTSKTYSGELKYIPFYVDSEFLAKLKPEISQAFLPFMLDTTSFRSKGYWGLLLIPPFFFAIWNIQKSFRRFLKPSLHPIYKSFRRYEKIDEVIERVNFEFSDSQDQIVLPKCELSTNWLCIPKIFTADFIHLGQVIWIYKEQTKHSYNFIPTGTTNKAMIIDSFGQVHEISSGKSKVDLILETLYEQIPWVNYGYSDQVDYLYRNNFDELLNLFDKRREQFLKNT